MYMCTLIFNKLPVLIYIYDAMRFSITRISQSTFRAKQLYKQLITLMEPFG